MNNPQSETPDGKLLKEEVQKGGSEYDENMETASERYSERPKKFTKAYPELQDEKPAAGPLEDRSVAKGA